jgi:hypothetical protein
MPFQIQFVLADFSSLLLLFSTFEDLLAAIFGIHQ